MALILIPIVIRGVHYESQAAAARAFNVSHVTITRAVNRGTQDRIGLGTGKRPIVWDGVEYSSIIDAARAAGLTRHKFRILRDSIDKQKKDTK